MIPFDAGLRWGLERGPFTAIWGECGGPDLLVQLQRVEALLQQRAPRRFDRRFWARVNLQTHAVPPTRLADLVAMASEDDHRPLPGVVIQVRSLELIMLGRLSEWNRTLRERVAHDQPLALIVEAPAHLAQHPRLSQALEPRSRRVEILLAAREADLGIDPEALNRCDAVTTHPPGAAYAAWFQALATNLERTETTPAVFKEVLNRIEGAPADPTSVPSASEVVADLDARADPDLDRSLLEAVARYWPERIASLIRAFALSRRPDARELPLALADSLSEEQRTLWLRSWIAGATNLSSEDVETTLDHFRHGRAKLNRDLLLAAFHQATQHPTCRRCENLLATLWNRGSPTAVLSSVFEHGRSGIIDARKILMAWGADHFILALRAGLRLSVRPGDLDALTLQHPDPWWILSASEPTADLVESLAGLGRDHRAIFGLLSASEREELARDQYLMDAIAECRRLTCAT